MIDNEHLKIKIFLSFPKINFPSLKETTIKSKKILSNFNAFFILAVFYR